MKTRKVGITKTLYSLADYERNSRAGFKAMLQGLKQVIGITDPRDFLSGKKLLDVGCGTGSDVKRFANLGAQACGLDINLVEPRKSLARKSLHFVRGKADALPVRAESFDFVHAKFLLDLLGQENLVPKFFEESFRILKPGGIFVAFGLLDSPGLIVRKSKELGFEPLRTEAPLFILKKPKS